MSISHRHLPCLAPSTVLREQRKPLFWALRGSAISIGYQLPPNARYTGRQRGCSGTRTAAQGDGARNEAVDKGDGIRIWSASELRTDFLPEGGSSSSSGVGAGSDNSTISSDLVAGAGEAPDLQAVAAAQAAACDKDAPTMSPGRDAQRDSDDEQAAFVHAFPGYMQSTDEEEGTDGYYQDSSVQGEGLGAASQHLWQRIRSEASREAASEPLLNTFYVTNVLQHDTFEGALAYILSRSLASSMLSAEELNKLFLKAFDEEKTLIRSALADAEAFYRRDPACSGYCQVLLHRLGYHAIQVQRVAHRLWLQKHKDLALTLQSRMSEVYAVDIHPGASLGRGMLLDHGTGVVIGETAVIGNNCSLLQNITLGGTGKASGDRHPKIMDNVLIGACTSILGNIVIGKGAQVGAGSLVLKPVAPHTMVAGSPSKVVGRVQGNPALRMQHDNRFIRQKRSDEDDMVVTIRAAAVGAPSTSPPRLRVPAPLDAPATSRSSDPLFATPSASSPAHLASAPITAPKRTEQESPVVEEEGPNTAGDQSSAPPDGASRTVAAAAGSAVSASVLEARMWIAKWRQQQQQQVSTSLSLTDTGFPTVRADDVAAAANVVQAREWIAAWRAQQQQQQQQQAGVTSAASQQSISGASVVRDSRAVPSVASNVAEARAWIAAWRAVQLLNSQQTAANVVVAEAPGQSSTAVGDGADGGSVAADVLEGGLEGAVEQVRAAAGEAWLAARRRLLDWRAKQQGEAVAAASAAAAPAAAVSSSSSSSGRVTNGGDKGAGGGGDVGAASATGTATGTVGGISTGQVPAARAGASAVNVPAASLTLDAAVGTGCSGDAEATTAVPANVATAQAWIAAWRLQQQASSTLGSSASNATSAAPAKPQQQVTPSKPAVDRAASPPPKIAADSTQEPEYYL